MGIETPKAPISPVPIRAVAAPPILQPALPAKPAPAQPPALAAISCLSDDAGMRKVPSRSPDSPDYRGKTYRRADGWLPQDMARKNTQVISYIYGACFFEDAADALATAFLPEHRI